MSNNYNAWGPYILWHDYGSVEGWKPRSYQSSAEALDQKERGDVITKLIKFIEVANDGTDNDQTSTGEETTQR